MADGGIPNKHRADSALTIYRDAMRQYIAPIIEREHGPNWIRSQVLNEQARERNERSYDRRLQSLESGSPPHRLIDLADIPFVIEDSHRAFPMLSDIDVHLMHTIRKLHNDIYRPYHEGYCTRGEADAVASLCVLALERCGLSEAAENIRSLSSANPASAAPEADLQKERARREWDKERQRLNDIAWEEEWERRERERLDRKGRERRALELGGKLSAGGFHSLGLCEDDTVVSWGDNGFGQHDAPAGKFVAVSAGGFHSLGLREDGTVVSWEANGFGQRDAPAGKFVAVSAGGFHSLGLRENGTVVRWEANGFNWYDAPVGKFVAVSAGGSHSLGLREDSAVVGWGNDDDGQCDTPAGKFAAVSAGDSHSLGLCEDGTVVGWGNDDDGQCDAPAGKFVAVSAGDSHSLGLCEDGTVVGWGNDDYGQCDAPEGQFVAVSAGGAHSLGLRKDGTVVGWGWDDCGQCDAPSDLRIR